GNEGGGSGSGSSPIRRCHSGGLKPLGKGNTKERAPVARRFRGSDTYKVDAKGRVSIPAPFRRVIESSDPDWKEGLRPNIVIVYGGKHQDWLEV
ncbi:MAG: hypothetical protein WBH04_01090, partial [Albidovulum sp.]